MVAEILAGIALAKSAVSGIQSMINTAKDVNDIAHHMDDLFKGYDQTRVKAAQAKQQPKKGNKEWNKYLTGKFKDDQEDAGTSISDVTAEIIEKKQIEEQMAAVKRMLNKRFGPDTWDEIIALRKERIAEHKKQIERQKEMDKIHAKESNEYWDKVWMWTWQSGVVICLLLVFWWWLNFASKGKIPFIW